MALFPKTVCFTLKIDAPKQRKGLSVPNVSGLIILFLAPGYFPQGVLCCVAAKGVMQMQKKLLTTGNIFKRTDGRWNGVVWYMDEQGERKRKSFSGTSKAEVKEKITEYIASFNKQLSASDESKARLEQHKWLKVFSNSAGTDNRKAANRVPLQNCQQLR